MTYPCRGIPIVDVIKNSELRSQEVLEVAGDVFVQVHTVDARHVVAMARVDE